MVLLEVSGDSMSPEIKDGDTVLIDRNQTDIYVGKIYAVSIGKVIMVRYLDRTPEKIILRSANDSWYDIEVGTDEGFREPINIVGRVIWWFRDIR